MARHFLHETPAKEGRVLASGGVPVHDDWEQFHSFVSTHFGPEDAALFAEPWKTGGATSWLHEQVQGARPLQALSPQEQAPIRARLADLWARISLTSDQMLASPRPDERHWGEVLAASLRFPSLKSLEEAIYVRDGQPLIVNWGMQDEASVTLHDLLQAPPQPPKPEPVPQPKPQPEVAPAPVAPIPQPVAAVAPRRTWVWPLWLLWMLIAAGLLLLLFLLWMLLRMLLPSLGLPSLPGMPDFGGLSAPEFSMPSLPSLPDLPGFPSLPAMPSLPDLGGMPSLGGLPDLGAWSGQAASPALLAEQARHSELLNRLAALRTQAVGLDNCAAVVPPAPEGQTALDRAREEAEGQVGDVTVTLQWKGHTDLDLMFLCPDGTQKASSDGRFGASVCGGGIDIDANLCLRQPTNPAAGCAGYESAPVDDPLENGFFVQGKAQSGQYGVMVRNFAAPPQGGMDPIPYELQVRIGEAARTFSGQLRPNESATVTTFTLD